MLSTKTLRISQFVITSYKNLRFCKESDKKADCGKCGDGKLRRLNFVNLKKVKMKRIEQKRTDFKTKEKNLNLIPVSDSFAGENSVKNNVYDS